MKFQITRFKRTGGTIITVAVGTIITDRTRTDLYVHVYAYGSYHGSMEAKLLAAPHTAYSWDMLFPL